MGGKDYCKWERREEKEKKEEGKHGSELGV